MSEWLIALISSGVLATLFVWAFQWGKSRGNVNTRLNDIERRLDDPQILPECSVIFTEIKENLATLTGKVDTILITMTKKQKNDEREHTQGKEKR